MIENGRVPEPSAMAGADSDQRRIEFIESELGLCFTFSVLTSIKYEAGDRNSAERSLGHAEEAFAAALPLVSDPEHSRHLSRETIQDFMAELVRLRERLDELHRLCNRPAEAPGQSTAKPARLEDQGMSNDGEWDGKKSLESILEEISELGDRQQIAALAYEFWQARGCPEGTAEEDWYLAKREIAERKAESRKLGPKPMAAGAAPRFPAESALAPTLEERNLLKRA